MKSNLLASVVVLAVTLFLGIPITQTGCTTPSQKARAYQTLGAVAVGVDTAYSAYMDAVVAGKVSLADQAKVRVAKQKYQVAFVAAVDVAKADLGALAPEDVVRLAGELSVALAVALGGK